MGKLRVGPSGLILHLILVVIFCCLSYEFFH